MMPVPPDAPLTVRLGARIGPETVASIFVIVVVIVAIAVAASGRQAGGASSPGASVAVVASAPSSSVAASGPPTASEPAEAVPAAAVLVIVDRLLGQRAGLEEELDRAGGGNASAIAELLRDVNASIVAQDRPLIDLAADHATLDLATRIRTVNAATSEVARRTLRATIRNAKAYRDGAADVIEQLEPLPAIRAELAELAGVTSSPTAASTQAAGTPDPSGATP